METIDLIPAEEFCTNYKVGFSFIHSLQQFGLISITAIEEKVYIPQAELKKLEQLARLHYDLDINFEGIDAITHLLDRLQEMQSEILSLKNRLRLYENE